MAGRIYCTQKLCNKNISYYIILGLSSDEEPLNVLLYSYDQPIIMDASYEIFKNGVSVESRESEDSWSGVENCVCMLEC